MSEIDVGATGKAVPLEMRSDYIQGYAAGLEAGRLLVPSVPDAKGPDAWHETADQKLADESYCRGWNDCRAAMLSAAQNPAPAQDDVAPLLARHISEWHEDDGPVMWWAWDGDRREWAGEPAWIGSPLSEDWPGYHTHWTPHPKMPAIDAALSAAKAGGAV